MTDEVPAEHRSAGEALVGVVLAAGKGTRMRSARPKVLHEVGGRPMLAWVLDAVRAAGCRRILVVVGHEAAAVRNEFADEDLEWVEQTEQRGTGHALQQVEPALSGPSDLLVVSGDVPLVSPGTLQELVAPVLRGLGGDGCGQAGGAGLVGSCSPAGRWLTRSHRRGR